MNTTCLPVEVMKAPVDYPYFPTRWQHFLWRNWELVPPERIAEVLDCSVEEVLNAAADLGLAVPPEVNPKWLTRGYLTLIRNNWQLLNYAQLLQLLKWTPEKLAYSLKEEDFLFHKLGKLKPDAPELKYAPLSTEETARTAEIKAVMEKYFPGDRKKYLEQPFAFSDLYKPVKMVGGREDFDFNFIHSYAASCGDVLGEAEELDPVPENLMAQYASMGIKGVWMHALLYLLYPIPGAEEYSRGSEKRIANLKKLVARCKKYGIRIFLYLNEPRCMPMEFYDKKPLWRGRLSRSERITICTTRTPEVLEYLENALRFIFTEVLDLGGVLTITASENATNCHYDLRSSECPSCSKFDPADIIAGVNAAIERGMHSVAPDARMLIYDWAWRRSPEDDVPGEFKRAVIDKLPKNKNVYINSVSEWGLITNVGGVEQYLRDYSISQVGPSEESKNIWKYAIEKGLQVCAKVQINNSWELSAVPYIPVPYLIREHLDNLKAAGVKGLMLSWTQGGFPGGNLELMTATPEEIANGKFAPELAKEVCRAWKHFSEAFRHFPFNVQVAYCAPMHFAPMNQLHLKPTGYNPTMVGFPFDNIDHWRAMYPADVFENQFRLLNDGWREGLEVLEKAAAMVQEQEKEEFNEIVTVATAAYCHLYSTLMQIRFVMARSAGAAETMKACAAEELKTALTIYDIARRDSRIGFEASNHYFYSLNDLREKIVNCEYVISELSR